jgi:DNA-directed RNA polymerase subunit RPC12/RpoP
VNGYRCSQCHTAFEVEGEAQRCPGCGAEAGLEPRHGVPLPMRLFGVWLGSAITLAIVGGVLGRVLG